MTGQAKPTHLPKIKPGLTRTNRASILLALGRYREAWEDFAFEQFMTHSLALENVDRYWDGSDLGGRTLLLYCNWGLGDSIQFVRFVSCLGRFNGRAVLIVPPELVRLVRSLPGGHEVVAKGDKVPRFDVQHPMMGVVRFLDVGLDNIPRVPYLAADPARVARWRLTG
jgi:hypothetical protein